MKKNPGNSTRQLYDSKNSYGNWAVKKQKTEREREGATSLRLLY